MRKSRSKINSKLKVLKENDYLLNPKVDGYNGFHIYIENPEDPQKKIEIQLRLKSTHMWASLVEIIDIIFNLKIKEGLSDSPIKDFLRLSSPVNKDITLEKIKTILSIDKRFKITEKLVKVFGKNFMPIRQNWLNTNVINENYFIFKVSEKNESSFKVYTNNKIAEKEYFEKFQSISNSKSNIVLAYINNPTFEKVCFAYASYLLVDHDYAQRFSVFYKVILEFIEVNIKNKDLSNDERIEIFNENISYINFINASRDLIRTNYETELSIIIEKQEELLKLDVNIQEKNRQLHKFKEWIEELQKRFVSNSNSDELHSQFIQIHEIIFQQFQETPKKNKG